MTRTEARRNFEASLSTAGGDRDVQAVQTIEPRGWCADVHSLW